MIKSRLLIIFTLVLSVLMGCSSDDTTYKWKRDPLQKSEQRTVLIYMAAANDLGGVNGRSFFDIADLNEMLDGVTSLSPDEITNANVLVYYENGNAGFEVSNAKGSEGKLVNKWGKRIGPKLYRLVKNAKTLKGELLEIKEYPIQLSTDPKVMGRVFKDAYGAYPSASYGLVMWSHADGWLEDIPSPKSRWIGQDVYDGESYTMDIPNFKEALTHAPYLDFIFYDLCLMQTAEVAYELRDAARYSIGSPAEIPGPGSPYDKMMPVYFSSKKDITESLADTYFKHYDDMYGKSSEDWSLGVSISVFNMEQVKDFADMTLDLLAQNNKSYTELISEGVFYYDPRRNGKHYFTDVIDLLNHSGVSQTPEWKTVYNSLVTYYKTTAENYSGVARKSFPMTGSHGISMYIPRGTSNYQSEDEYFSKLEWGKLMLGY